VAMILSIYIVLFLNSRRVDLYSNRVLDSLLTLRVSLVFFFSIVTFVSLIYLANPVLVNNDVKLKYVDRVHD
jgi:hypothetical protein